jgi:protease IV
MSKEGELQVQTAIETMLLDYFTDKKRAKFWRRLRWSIVIIVVLVLASVIIWDNIHHESMLDKPHVGLIDIKGPIFDSPTFNSGEFYKSLEKAYKSSGLKAVWLRIDSPGGSPVQADDVYTSIEFFRKKYPDIKVYALCLDLCASAAYYIAAASDAIYANPSSMVGSIGVVYSGFGFQDAMTKLGVERRLFVAGQNKGFLDPFSSEKPEEVAYLQTMLNTVYAEFIAKVRAGRGARLKEDANTFSGLVWTGVQAKTMGLIDGFANSNSFAHDIVGVDKVIDYTTRPNFLDNIAANLGISTNLGAFLLKSKPQLVA